MNTISPQVQSDLAQQRHDIAFDAAAVEACRRSPNTDRLDTSLLAAKLHAKRSADESRVPQTIFRTPHTDGWWHTHSFARLLEKAEVFATILPACYFH